MLRFRMQMSWIHTALVAVALAMDAFAVSMVTGFTLEAMTRRHLFRMSFHFGLFQALMTGLGWAAGTTIHRYIQDYDHWVAFALLALVGGNMIRGAFRDDEHQQFPGDPTRGWRLVMLSVATSIDALAVGLSLAMAGSAVMSSASVIGVVAAVFTLFGMFLGRQIGLLWGKRVEVLGGLILLGIGASILVQHI